MLKVCPYPFSRIELNGFESYIPCCEFWLKKEYYKLSPGDDLFNGEQAVTLRKKMLQGDFSFCNRHLCHVHLLSLDEIKENLDKVYNETPITSATYQKMIVGDAILSDGPSSISIGGDRRCNLACPTCRSAHKTNEDEQVKRNIKSVTKHLNSYSKSALAIKISGNGETFFSPWLKDLLKNADQKRFPKLEYINLLTNGTLASEDNFIKLKPGIDKVQEISVSIDAGDEETYKKVRGFSWEILNNNLKFISKLRQHGKIKVFRMLFVVRKENFRSMENFVKLGEKLKVDTIQFSQLSYWPNTDIDFYGEAIFLPTHPLYSEFVEIYNRLKNNKIVRLDFSLDETK